MMKKSLLFLIALTLGFGITVSAQYPGWSQYYVIERVTCLVADDNFMWVGSDLGLVRIDLETDDETYFNYANSGLPSNMIHSIALGPDGTAYIATFAGLAVFNGTTWQVHDSLNSPLSTSSIYDVAVTSDNNVWVAAGTDVLMLDPNGEWTVHEQDETGFPGQVNAIAVDMNDLVLASSESTFGVLYDTIWTVEDIRSEGLLTNLINDIAVDSANRVWIGTPDGLAVRRLGIGWWNIYNAFNSQLEYDIITSLSVGDNNHLYIGNHSYGLIEFVNDSTGNDTTWIKHGSPVEDEYGSMVNGVVSKDGQVWVGTNSGLYRLQDETWTRRKLANAPLKSNKVTEIEVDQDNVKWIGYRGEGLMSFDGTTWNSYDTANSDIPGNYINELAIDNVRQVVWVATDGGLASFDGNEWVMIDSTPNQLYRAVEIADDGTAWVASIEGLQSYDGEEWTNHDYVEILDVQPGINDLQFDLEGTLWIATDWNGVIAYDGTNWNNYTQSNSGLPFDGVISIAVDSSNSVWFGTNTNSLASYDGSEWTKYTVAAYEYIDNFLIALAIDDEGTKWIGAKGPADLVYQLSTLSADTVHTVLNYKNSGFPHYVMEDIAIDKDGTVWIASRGIVTFQKDTQVSVKNPRLPTLDVSAYPNPAKGTLYFKTGDNSIIIRVDLLETNGSLVKTIPVNGDHGNLSLEQLPAGVYLLRINAEPGTAVKKIVKQ